MKYWENIWKSIRKFNNGYRIIDDFFIFILFYLYTVICFPFSRQCACITFINKNTWIEKMHCLSFCGTLIWNTFGLKLEFSSCSERKPHFTIYLLPLCVISFYSHRVNCNSIAFVVFFSFLPIWCDMKDISKQKPKTT